MLVEPPIEQRPQPFDNGSSTGGRIRRFMVFDKETPGEIGNGDSDRRLTENGHQKKAGLIAESGVAWCPTAPCGTEFALIDQAEFDQGCQPVGDSGPANPETRSISSRVVASAVRMRFKMTARL
jgi:hypothetical protein